MNLVIAHGVVDNDPKGTTGVGTIFWLEIRVDAEVKERHEYGLLEQLDGRFNVAAITKPYIVARDIALEEQAAKEAEEKRAEKEARAASVKIDDTLQQLIDEVIAGDPKAVEQFKAGKEKALNALVGKVIGELKKQGQEANAFAITTTMKKKLA